MILSDFSHFSLKKIKESSLIGIKGAGILKTILLKLSVITERSTKIPRLPTSLLNERRFGRSWIGNMTLLTNFPLLKN